MLKKYFFTGLVLLLPAVITIFAVVFFINLLTRPFQDIIFEVFKYYDLLNTPFFFISEDHLIYLISKLLALFIIGLTTLCIGFLTKVFITNTFINLTDSLIHKIPLINRVYKAAQDVVKTLLKEERQSFSQVVFVPFPHDGALSIGMITRDDFNMSNNEDDTSLLSVFVPATPNPTMGFMLSYRKDQLIFVDMTVEDALRAVVSCGVIFKTSSNTNDEKYSIFKNN